MNLPALCHEEHISVATHRCVARPLISGEHNKSTVFMIFGNQFVQIFPERIVNLKIIGLMAWREVVTPMDSPL